MTDGVQIPTACSVTRLLLVVGLLITPVSIGGASATDGPQESAFVVALADDGSARVGLVLVYDLGRADDRAAFERLRDDSEDRMAVRDRFVERLTPVVERTASATGRTMELTAPTVETAVEDERGVLTVEVTWRNLAVRDGDTLVLTTPFDDGFTPDRRFSVRAPAGHELVASGPTPDSTGDRAVTWNAGRSLDGVEVRSTPVDRETRASDTRTEPTGDATGPTSQTTTTAPQSTDTTGATGPGLGVVTALVAVIVVVTTVARRRG